MTSRWLLTLLVALALTSLLATSPVASAADRSNAAMNGDYPAGEWSGKGDGGGEGSGGSGVGDDDAWDHGSPGGIEPPSDKATGSGAAPSAGSDEPVRPARRTWVFEFRLILSPLMVLFTVR